MLERSGIAGDNLVVVKAVGEAKPPAAVSSHVTTPTDKLIHDIGVTYYKHGHLQSEIDKIKDNLYDECDRMQPPQCSDYLHNELLKAQKSPDVE